MAEKVVSPGVFTRERDLSFLPAGVQNIGAAIVGPTVKGPALIPTLVSTFAEYRQLFGDVFESGSRFINCRKNYGRSICRSKFNCRK